MIYPQLVSSRTKKKSRHIDTPIGSMIFSNLSFRLKKLDNIKYEEKCISTSNDINFTHLRHI